MSDPTKRTRRKRASFHVIEPFVSRDTIQALEELLEDARAGHCVGVAFAAMYRRNRMVLDTAGECTSKPVHTVGMLNILTNRIMNGR